MTAVQTVGSGSTTAVPEGWKRVESPIDPTLSLRYFESAQAMARQGVPEVAVPDTKSVLAELMGNVSAIENVIREKGGNADLPWTVNHTRATVCYCVPGEV